MNDILAQLEQGKVRVATQAKDGNWKIDLSIKQAILEVFKIGKNKELTGKYSGFVDKHNLLPREFTIQDKVRMVPGGSAVRRGAYVASGVIIMPPSYINIGAYVDEGSMIDSNVVVGTCAQIGKNVHVSAGVQIGGVLEPIGVRPVIIEDDVFIGAGCTIVEGMLIRKRAVIAPGVVLSNSVPIYDCINEKILTDNIIPEGVVIVPGTRPMQNEWAKEQKLNMYCPLIIKYRDEKSDGALKLEKKLR